ncbi:MAG: adenosylcobinamide-GDP ribazoletransferase [Nitrospirae bacterium]|nr:adenosylcobinamide-GDP ribazoletransferase [Nitrospirota bacterium]
MKDLLTAMSILTALPLNRRMAASDGDLARSTLFFPVVGFMIGFLLMGVTQWLAPILSPEPLAAVLLVVSILLTGGLHLDGLADLCDGLAAGGGRERILAVMKDSRIGAFGVMGLTMVLLLKYSLFLEVIRHEWLRSFLIMGVLSRWAMVLAAFWGRYARDEGTARPFIGQIRRSWFVGSTGMTLGFAWMIFKGPGLLAVLSVFLFVFLFLRYLELKMGGLTGDALGAINEMIEVLVLLLIAFAAPFLEPY